MQLTPRYLVNNTTIVLLNESGFTVEYRPVYTRQLKVYRGIDNALQFRLLNPDQKPVVITGTPVFVAFDEEQSQVLKYECDVLDDGSSIATRGLFTVTISENDLLNIKQQYLNYNVYLENTSNTLTYADRDFNSSGIIFVDGRAFPGPKNNIEITDFHFVNNTWVAGNMDSNRVTADPGLNGNDALHTVAVYTNGYVGNLKIQATLDAQITGINNWTDLKTIAFTGNESEPAIHNINGVYAFLRFEFDTDPTDTVDKILVRN